LIGFLAAYRDGLELVARAVESLQTHFSRVTLRYIGPPSQLAYIPESLRELTEHLGVLVGDELDRALMDCDCGLLPGPLPVPEYDQRSKYSVPSRAADYLAVGLPIIATIHPDSATSLFFSSLRGRGFFPVTDSKGLVGALRALREEEVWLNASNECEAFFSQRCDAGIALKEFYSIANSFLQRGAA
jgi:glycosyltransferase involved in cell wall biosynthesis